MPAALLPAIEREGLRMAAVEPLKELLCRAQGWLGEVPGAEAAVLRLVGKVHPLAAEAGYDVSHSQPCWLDRVFVSCPERSDDVGALRLAEGVLHEAMHLHLTNEEQRAPLIAASGATAHSPWRDEDRPVQGVMHGLFVFACIHRFMRVVEASLRPDDAARRHVEQRLDTIAGEIRLVDVKTLATSLTPRGHTSVASWIASSGLSQPSHG